MLNTINLKNISVFKISIFLFITIYLNNIYIYILTALILFLYNKKNLIIFIPLLLLILFTNSIKTDFINIGVIDYKNGSYYQIDKLLYKTKLITEDELYPGDFILFNNDSLQNSVDSQVKKNIKYYTYTYDKVLLNNPIRKFINNRINSFDDNTKTALLKFIYNITSYDNVQYNFIFGLSSYYFLKFIKDKNRVFGLISIFLYSFCFVFEYKLIFLIVDILFEKINKSDRFAIKVIVILLLNKNLLFNYSLLIPLLFSLYGIIDFKIKFHTYLFLIESLLFGEINVISSFIFSKMISLRVIVFIISLIQIFLPFFNKLYSFVINIYSFISSIDIPVRGRISLFSLLMVLYIWKSFKLNNSNIMSLILVLFIILPTNNPIFHVSFIDVGQGDSTLIHYGIKRSCVLIDTGSLFNYYKLKSKLISEGIYTIDYLIISHNDSDHNGNVEALQNDFYVKNIILEGQDIDLKDIYYKYLYLGEYDNDNDNSLVYLVNIDGYDFLFTGDISKKIERKLVNDYGPLNIDFLKVSHHGSYTGSSEYFISSILPKFSTISTNGQYNHPSKDTLNILNKYESNIFITKHSGSINVYFTKLLDWIKTDKNEYMIFG